MENDRERCPPAPWNNDPGRARPPGGPKMSPYRDSVNGGDNLRRRPPAGRRVRRGLCSALACPDIAEFALQPIPEFYEASRRWRRACHRRR